MLKSKIDVTAIPEDNGTWFQLILNNGTTVINNGTNGLQKLDFIVEQAERFGLYLIREQNHLDKKLMFSKFFQQ